MKRVLTLSLILVLALSLTVGLSACGGGSGGSTDANTANTDAGNTTDTGSDLAKAQDNTLIGEWISYDSDLYIVFFEDDNCIYAPSEKSMMDTYTATKDTITLAGGGLTLGHYALANGILTMNVNGTDYDFTRPARQQIEGGDYSAKPDDWASILSLMQDSLSAALNDKLAKIDGDKQTYDTEVLTFTIPASAGEWADYEDNNISAERTDMTFYGKDAKIAIQCQANITSGSDAEKLKAEFQEDYPDATTSIVTVGADSQYEMARRTLPGKPQYLMGKFYVEQADGQFTWFQIEITAEDESITGETIWDSDAVMQGILNTLVIKTT